MSCSLRLLRSEGRGVLNLSCVLLVSGCDRGRETGCERNVMMLRTRSRSRLQLGFRLEEAAFLSRLALFFVQLKKWMMKTSCLRWQSAENFAEFLKISSVKFKDVKSIKTQRQFWCCTGGSPLHPPPLSALSTLWCTCSTEHFCPLAIIYSWWLSSNQHYANEKQQYMI